MKYREEGIFSQQDLSFLESLGVVDWGYTEEEKPRSYSQFEAWIKKGNHGPLKYLSDHRKDLRQNLRQIFPEFQSAIVFLFSYASFKLDLQNYYLLQEKENGERPLKIASYALAFGGEDYHFVLKDRLETLAKFLQQKFPSLTWTLSLDIQPVLERDLAYRAGLGWFGKNSMLISRHHGSYFMIGSLLLSQKLVRAPFLLETDHCGQCSACINACPTKAIDPVNRQILANQCISTFSIEIFKEQDPPQGYLKSQGEIFGCDICQEVCPWNQRLFRSWKKEGKEPLLSLTTPLGKARFPPLEFLLNFFSGRAQDILDALTKLSKKDFSILFKRTALERTGKRGLMKNLRPFLNFFKS